MLKRLTEAERQIKILEALPDDGGRIRVTELVRLLKMSPRKVNIHLEDLADKGMVNTEYFPGDRAPLRLVWLTNARETITGSDTGILLEKPIRRDVVRERMSLSKRRKIKDKVMELLN